MSPKSAKDLSRLLISLRLVKEAQITQCASALKGSTGDELLQELERRQCVTSYQAGKIRKGSTDGLVLGKYKLMYRNASGSFARVFRAESIVDGQMVGLKLLRNRWAQDPKSVENFHREANICRRFKHENIVPIYDVGSKDDYHYFTMEFVEGGNLRDFIKIRGKLSPAEASRCIRDVCNGLDYALKKGATHRDMKMTNVLMSSTGVAKLVDFGLAGERGDHDRFDDDGAGRALEYATLERGTNAPYADPRSDLFFTGAIFYELLSGKAPWPLTRSREERKTLSRYTNIESLSSHDPTIPQPVVRIVEKLIDANPNQRYQRPGDAAADLQEVLLSLDPPEKPAKSRSAKSRPSKASSAAKSSVASNGRRLLCVESREKIRDGIRAYFKKHGYRVILVADPERARQRMESDPPDCVLVMGEAVGEKLPFHFREFSRIADDRNILCFTVLSERQIPEFRDQLTETDLSRVFVQPVTVSRLRKEFATQLK